MFRITNRIKGLCLVLCIMSSIANIYPNSTDIVVQEETPSFNAIEFLDKVVKQINNINVALEELSLIINSNTSKIANKTLILFSIRQHRELTNHVKENIQELISSLRDNPTLEPNPATLKMLVGFNTAFIKHMRESIGQGLQDFPLFDLESLTQKNSQGVSPNDLAQALDSNNSQLKYLSTDIQSVGLTWYNKVYRSFDSTIVHPFEKYNMGRYLKWATIIGAAGAVAAWQYKGSFEWAFGPKLEYNENTGKISNYEALGKFGKANYCVYEHTKGFLPINSWIYGACLAATLPELAVMKNYVSKKIGEGINYLKGGAYTNKKSQEIEKILPKVTLKDLVGLDHVKEVFNLIVKYIEDPERFDRTKLTPEKGFLLTGPTRTGKTFSAEALAGEIREMFKRNGKDPDEFNFFVLRASFIKERGVRWIFEKAKEVAPCILFVDEIDLLQLQRGGGNADLLSEFLTSMSGCLETNDPKKPVIIIGATNLPENMDVALRQRGRFGTELRYQYPSEQDRIQFFDQKLSALSLNPEDFDIPHFVRQTEKCSYEDLNAMLRGAFHRARLRGETLTLQHLEDALDREIRHIIVNSDIALSDHENTILAVHQAGHALATMLLDGKQKLAKVTIKPYQAQIREEAVWEQYYKSEEEKQKKIVFGKTFTYHEHDTVSFDSHAEKIKKCKVQLAGHAAEKIVLGSCGYSYHGDDSQRALELAKSIAFEGIDIQAFPDNLKIKYIDKALELKKQCETEITELLLQHKEMLNAVIAALKERKTLTREQMEKIMRGESLEEAPRKPVEITAEELGLQEEKPLAAPAA